MKALRCSASALLKRISMGILVCRPSAGLVTLYGVQASQTCLGSGSRPCAPEVTDLHGELGEARWDE